MKQTSNKTVNKTKRTIAAFLAAVTVLTAFAGCSGKDEESSSSSQNSTVSSDSNSSSSSSSSQTENLSTTNDDEFKYYLSDDEQSYEISRYKGEDAAIYNIPSEHDGLKVTAIAGMAYKQTESIVEVNIPDTVAKIGYNSFTFCTNLERVNMGNGVEIIEDSAFIGCEKLSELTLSENLTEIQASGFQRCTSLKKVTIPDGVTTIGEVAFGGCTSLEEIHIPASVTEMRGSDQSGVFANSDKVTVYAPAGSYAEQYAKDNDIPFVAE